MTYCHCGMTGSVYCAGANCYALDVEEEDDADYWHWLEQQADAISGDAAAA